jgi:hypothetical protein
LIGLVPIVIQRPSLGNVYYYSMALVIMGGLLISTVLTSLLLPTTVSLAEDFLGWLSYGLAMGFYRVRLRATRPLRTRISREQL